MLTDAGGTTSVSSAMFFSAINFSP